MCSDYLLTTINSIISQLSLSNTIKPFISCISYTL